MEVEWDPEKNRENERKHGISFADAADLFTSGDDYLEIFDSEHSDDEDRFIAIGAIVRGVVVVVWTERAEDVVRMISARPATFRETRLFQKYRDDD